MQHTENYNFKKPEPSDYADIGAINDNMDAVDAALHGLEAGKADLVGGKVPAAQLPAMNYVPTSRMVNGKSLSGDISLTAADVGADAGGTAAAAVAAHNADTAAHADIRAEVAARGVPYRYTATIPTSGWSGSSSTGYTQTITLSGITADMTPTVDVVQSSDAAAAKLQLETRACISRIVTGAGQVTIYCYGTLPQVTIPVQFVGVI